MRLASIIPLIIIVFFSCTDKCEEISYYTTYEPVYTLKEEVKAAVTVLEPRAIETPEKLYFKDNYVFLVESGQGIHIINNSDATNPRTEHFINIPGNHDVAIQDNYLYADSYTDLLVFDVSDIDDITLHERVESVFEYYGVFYMESGTDASTIVTDWEEVEVESIYEYDCNSRYDDEATVDVVELDGISSEGSGVGGSMARFTITNDHLYAVDYSSIRPFDISDASSPEPIDPVYIGWDIETVFPYDNNLFIGSMSGMYIYGLSDPAVPEFISVFQHAQACDPVVVQGNTAFITLRDGTECQNFINQLDVVDISDLSNPTLIKTYEMDHPHGLGIRNECLYICEGEYGLKYFDASDVENITLKKHFTDIHSLDVIPLQNSLLMIGNDGFYQYDGLCEDEIQYLSTIAF